MTAWRCKSSSHPGCPGTHFVAGVVARSPRHVGLAQAQHRAILEAIEAREGTRAEALAREHARLAKQNLKLALGDAARLASVPGNALIRRDHPNGGRKIAS